MELSLCDRYTDDQPAGQVIGTRLSDQTQRQGCDREGQMAIDHGALRLQPLLTPGWGRQGIAYGPYPRRNGLGLAIFLVNGHNTSQSGVLGESLIKRILRWLYGSGTDFPLIRLVRWLGSPQKTDPIRQFRWWARNATKQPKTPSLNENLAVGWFPEAIPTNPLIQGNGFIVHATGEENGELWIRVGDRALPVIRGLQNLPMYYVVILREHGAAYYATSVPNAHGLVAYPALRPLAIDPFNQDETVYGALYQSVLGQIGFRVDTRVYGTRIEPLTSLETWYGTAHVADRLLGVDRLQGSKAEVGGRWISHRGAFQRSPVGTQPLDLENLATLTGPAPTGLLHTLVELPTPCAAMGVVWRFQDLDNYWELRLSHTGCTLYLKYQGEWRAIATDTTIQPHPTTVNSLQILDDGTTLTIALNGQQVFQQWITDSRLQHATGIGLSAEYSERNAHSPQQLPCFRAFEAHPRAVPLPPALNLGAPPQLTGSQIIIREDFDGAPRSLQGKTTTFGHHVWERSLGRGSIALTGTGTAKVQASVQHPNPGRTAYTLPWATPTLADLQVTITPPGTERWQAEKGRAGLIFWQDARNYLILNTWLDDIYGGASISSFFYLDGYEDLYDAVWTNVGSRVVWGQPFTLRVAFDGLHYMAWVNEEPVLYRSLTDVYPKQTRLQIRRVGLVANWEWGNDTGSVFSHFIARR